MRVGFYGGVEGVTGSCFLLEADNKKVLIDCGLFQGLEEPKNYEPFPFNPREIDYVVLTHAHIDHCGRIPLLVREGFRGKIISTEATKRIALLMLLDAAKVMYENYKVQLRKLQRVGKVPNPPLYEEYDVLEAIELFRITLPYDKEFNITNNLKITLKDAGHILGSAFVEVEVYENKKSKRLIFSGDLGNKNKPIVRDPQRPSKADYVFVETT
jgi:metallo-beta-lactamase family protein